MSRPLDGLRALAILIVFLGHATHVPFIPGGFGVTIFFALSGYLIGSLLRVELETSGRIDFRRFYIKRFFRINLPLWAAMGAIAATGLAFRMIPPPQLGHISSQALFYSNYYDWLTASDVTARSLDGSLPIPLWSLAVEEHFYLVFPLLLSMIWNRSGMRGVRAFILLTLGGSLALRAFHVFILGDLTSGYYLTHTRLDSITWGALLAFGANPLLDRTALPLRRRWFLLALAGLAGSLLIRNPMFRETLRYTVQSGCIYLVLRYTLQDGTGPVGRFLSHPALGFIARHSYAMYLTHYFVIVAVRQAITQSPLPVLFISFAGTLLASLGLHLLIERPGSRLRDRLLGAGLRRATQPQQLYKRKQPQCIRHK